MFYCLCVRLQLIRKHVYTDLHYNYLISISLKVHKDLRFGCGDIGKIKLSLVIIFNVVL